MSDSLDTGGAAKQLLVDGRNPTADEVISVSDTAILSVAPADSNGAVFVSAIADGTATITVEPGADDIAAHKSAGTDDVTAATPTPLVISLV